ncbi:hypothetical protein RJ639_009972 [Escallonia herrerae]|uniref:J domain-containing protein n=1 Tax=Escallonia herrerae TaxID=1293975 RepID=A0AA88VSK1_9ASTE|nr:hypothetical protein RJ639_009972 [Escallonia herrerae]
MGCLPLNSKTTTAPFLIPKPVNNHSNRHEFPSTGSFSWLKSSTSPFTVNCRSSSASGDEALSTSSAYSVLGVAPNCSLVELKAAFRAKVKQFHPDVRKDGVNSDTMIRRVIQAYEKLSNYSRSEIIESILGMPYDCSAEADLLYSLIVKAKFENNRYRKPKKQPKIQGEIYKQIKDTKTIAIIWGVRVDKLSSS